jgi:hypothetical protein
MGLKNLVANGLLARSVLGQIVYAGNTRPFTPDSPAVSTNFPEPNITLYSPAFSSPDTVPDEFSNGTAAPTSEETLIRFLQTLSERNEWMTYMTPNFTSEEGRKIPYVLLSFGPSNGTAKGKDKLRIYVHGSMHGDEPGGEAGVSAFLGKLDNEPQWAASVLDKADLLVLPRYNADGVAYFQRLLATSFDPNRDFSKAARQQTRNLQALVTDFNPHISVDCHEYGAGAARGPNQEYLPAQDGQYSAFKNMNIHPSIRQLAEGLFRDEIATAMDERGFTHSPYVVSSDPENLVFNEFITDNDGFDQVGLSQGIAYLSETRGIGIGDQHFRRRAASTLTVIETIVRTAVDHADDVLRTIEDARAKYTNSEDEIIVSSYPRKTNITWDFIHINGTAVSVPITFGNNTPAIANLTRPRPEAYIFSRAWADVAERLTLLGVEVETLEQDFVGEVEAYNITSAQLATSKFQGVAQTSIAAELITRNVSIPAGGFRVPSRQRHAAHVFARLEPEAESSFARWNVLNVGEGDIYPVYRIPRIRAG